MRYSQFCLDLEKSAKFFPWVDTFDLVKNMRFHAILFLAVSQPTLIGFAQNKDRLIALQYTSHVVGTLNTKRTFRSEIVFK
jgi:hypothetical protein